MTELRLKFSWWRPADGFRWVERTGSRPGGPTYAVDQVVTDGPYRRDPPWLVGLPLQEEMTGNRYVYDFSKEGKGLHRRLAEVATDPEPILEFANAWGRLTLSGGVIVSERGGEVTRWYRAEPVGMWRTAIHELRDALLLWELRGGATGEADEEGLRQVVFWEGDQVMFWPAGKRLWHLYMQRAKWSHQSALAAMRGDSKEMRDAHRMMDFPADEIVEGLKESGRVNLGIPLAGPESPAPPAFRIWQLKRDVIGPARWKLATITSERLKGVNVAIEPAPHGAGFTTVLQPKDLLSAVWLELFLEVTGKRKLRQCPMCGNWFDATRSPRQVFCTARGSGCRQKASRLRRAVAALLKEGKGLTEAAEELSIDCQLAQFLVAEDGPSGR